MKESLIDTNIISAFMRGNNQVIQKVKRYLIFYNTLAISVISYYEITRGIKALSNVNKLKMFKGFMANCTIEVIDSSIAEKASNIYHDLRNNGQLVEDADILIAATAMDRGLCLVSDNSRHFNRISGLELDNWLVSS